MQTIGFGHRSRVGKDTAARLLHTILRMKGYRVKHVSFANDVKMISHILYAHLGLQDKEYYDNHPDDRTKKLPKINKTPVEIWVDVGCSMREIYEDTWVDILLAKNHNCDFLIISDVRFFNEVLALDILIKVTRKEAPIYTTKADNALELFNDWNHVIENDGSLSDLNSKLLQICAERNI